MPPIPPRPLVLAAALLAGLVAVGCGQYAGVHERGSTDRVGVSPAGVSSPSPAPSISPDDGVGGPAEDAIVGDSTQLTAFRHGDHGSKSKKNGSDAKDGGAGSKQATGSGDDGSGGAKPSGSGGGDRTGASGTGKTDKASGGKKDGGSTATTGNGRSVGREKRQQKRSVPRSVPASVQEVLLKGAEYNSTILPEGFPFVICPVQGRYAYSDDYGAPRYAGGYHPHAGNDVFAEMGTPVVAPFDGYVEKAENTLGGQAVRVHGELGYVYMAHLSAYAPGVPGNVRAGQVVGFVGNTGDAQGTSPHDHFEWHPKVSQAYDRVLAGANGAVDPYRYLRVVCPPGPS